MIDILKNKILKASLECHPFSHIVIDNFYDLKSAKSLAEDFKDIESDSWYRYDNAIENKLARNDLAQMGKPTNIFFDILFSDQIIGAISKKFEIKIEPDRTLYGAGQHLYSHGGNLNPHLDFSIHPINKKERRLSLLFYLTDNYQIQDGGNFGLWESSSATEPGTLIKEYSPLFNRLIIFDSSQNSWHGLSTRYMPKTKKFRKSLACYYLSEPRKFTLGNEKAVFAPRESQKKSKEVAELIALRSDKVNFHKAYLKK